MPVQPPTCSAAPEQIGCLDKHHTSAAFRAAWMGLSEQDLRNRAVYEVCFGRLIRPVWPTLEGVRVLDVGCGAGRWLRWYLEVGAHPADIAGVDISEARFKAARAMNPLIALHKIDGEHLPFDDHSFDLVTQWTCFMCVPTPSARARLATEILRVLKPGGYVFWLDTLTTHPKLADGARLQPQDLFPTLPIVLEAHCARQPPSERARNRFDRFIRRLFLDPLAGGSTHLAARLGPKL